MLGSKGIQINSMIFFIRILYLGIIDEFTIVRRVEFKRRGKIINVLNYFRCHLRCFRHILNVIRISVIFSVLRFYYNILHLLIGLRRRLFVLGIITATCRQKQRYQQTCCSQILQLLFHNLRLLFLHLLKLLLFSTLIICQGTKKRPTPKAVLG